MTKEQFYDGFFPVYQRLLRYMNYRLIRRFGSQRKLAEFLQIDRGNLSRILSGTVKCNSMLFYHLILLSNMCVDDNELFVDTVPPSFDKTNG